MFLANHIEKFSNRGHGQVSYLSSTISDEFIQLLGEYVLSKILKEAKYFGIIVDSTPDLQHVDQLSFILRYVNPKSYEVHERFLKFLPIKSHKGSALSQEILEFLQNCNLDIQNCRSQSYDNAANMSGKYSGVQSKIKDINDLV